MHLNRLAHTYRTVSLVSRQRTEQHAPFTAMRVGCTGMIVLLLLAASSATATTTTTHTTTKPLHSIQRYTAAEGLLPPQAVDEQFGVAKEGSPVATTATATASGSGCTYTGWPLAPVSIQTLQSATFMCVECCAVLSVWCTRFMLIVILCCCFVVVFVV